MSPKRTRSLASQPRRSTSLPVCVLRTAASRADLSVSVLRILRKNSLRLERPREKKYKWVLYLVLQYAVCSTQSHLFGITGSRRGPGGFLGAQMLSMGSVIRCWGFSPSFLGMQLTPITCMLYLPGWVLSSRQSFFFSFFGLNLKKTKNSANAGSLTLL